MSAVERCPRCGATSPVFQGGECGGCLGRSVGLVPGSRRGLWLNCMAPGCGGCASLDRKNVSDAQAAAVYRANGWTGEGDLMMKARCPDCAQRKAAAQVVGFCWEVNADHPRLRGKAYQHGGKRVTLGQRGPLFTTGQLEPGRRPWGLTQVWIMRNGQEVRVTWKARA